MINLFDNFDTKTIILYKSFKHAGMNVKTIVMEETGFLPEDVMTPYRFFANNNATKHQPLYFNQLNVPRFWMIEGNGDSAVVKNKTELKAKIFYKKNFKNRIIERVEWLNGAGKTQFVDYYNQYGFKYAKLIVEPDTQHRIMKFYYNDRGETVLTEYFVTNDIILNWKGQSYQFHSIIEFMNFFIEASGLNNESFLYNSLVKPPAIINQLQTTSHDYLYWQGDINDNTVNHMHHALQKQDRNLKIIAQNQADYRALTEKLDDEYQSRVIQGGYVYRKLKDNTYSNQVLCLTNSDQVIHLEAIVKAYPDLEFHIAALTTMSDKLLNLKQYGNVHLYPNVSKAKCVELYKTCDIYLDINRGNEILDAVRAAFDYSVLILAYEEVAHNLDVTAPENVMNAEDEHGLINVLNDITHDHSQFKQRLQWQIAQAGGITPKSFKQIFE